MKRQSVTSSILWLTIAEIFFNFSGYIIHSFLGRILGPADYGRYGLVVTLTTMMIMLIGNGIPTAMSKFISGIFETQPALVLKIKRRAAFLQLVIISVVSIIFFLSAPLLAALLRDPTLIPLFRLSTLIIPAFAAAAFYLYYFIGIHRFNLQSTMKIVRSFARIFFVILLAYFFGLKGSISGYILAPVTVFLVAFLIDRFRVSRQLPPASGENFAWQKLIQYAWPVTLFMLFYEMLISLDLYLVKGILMDDHLTGIYNAALTVGRIPYYLFYALTLVMIPSISRTVSQENHSETNKILATTFRFLVILLVPMVILMVIYAVPLIQLFFGSRYAAAAVPMQILAPGVGFLTVFYVLSFAFNGAGKVKVPMYVSLFGMIFNAILNYALIIRYGIVGSAAATSITSVIITVIIFIFTAQNFGSFANWPNLFKTAAAGAALWILSLLFQTDTLLFIAWSLLLLAAYFYILHFFGIIKKNDMELFAKIIRRQK